MEEALASVPRNFLAPVGHQRRKKKKGARCWDRMQQAPISRG